MTKYLETKRNSIEEAISSVVLGEKHNYVVIDADGKILGFADDVSQANTMVGREGKAGRAGYNKLTKPIERNQGSKLGGKSYKSITNFLSDKDVKFMSKKVKEEIDEKFSITLPPVRGGKKLLNIDMGRAIRMLKDFGATKSDIRNVLSGRGGRFQNANGEMFFVQRESVELDEAKYEVQYTVGSRVGDSRSRTKSRLSKIDIDARSKDDAEKKFFKQAEKSPMMRDAMRRDMLDVVYVGLKESLDEGYESEVLKVLKDADIEGYFKMGKLYVSRRDAKDAKKALEDSDEITKLPKMVMEVYDIGQDYAKHTLEVTPGQSKDDVDEMLGIAEKKRTSMREALAKMWGLDEGKNPFKKSEEKDLTKEGEHDKTLTGKKPTKVDVDPELKDK